jgi:hypothetical protein
MAVFDAHVNLVYVTVVTAPSPRDTGTSAVLLAGDGAKLPAAPFNATAYPPGVDPLTTTGEIVRVTVIATDTLTIVRAQESSIAKSIDVGWRLVVAVTAKTVTDLESALITGWQNPNDTWTFATASTFTVPRDITGEIGPGDKIRLTQSATIRYFYVLSAAFSAGSTTVTIMLNSDYTLANSAITAPGFSHAVAPIGFPDYFNYVPTVVTGWSSTTTTLYRYKVAHHMVTLWLVVSGTSNATGISIKLPVSGKSNGGFNYEGNYGLATNNGTNLTNTGRVVIDPGIDATVISAYTDQVSGAWVGSGSKGIRSTAHYEF